MNVRPSAFIKKDESILTLRYCYGNTHVYALPGGNPDSGESLADALSRELKEELAINVTVQQMVVCGEVIWTELKKETLHVVFLCDIREGIPELQPEHTTALEIVWLPFTELSKCLLYPNVGNAIAEQLTGVIRPVYAGVIDQPYIR